MAVQLKERNNGWADEERERKARGRSLRDLLHRLLPRVTGARSHGARKVADIARSGVGIANSGRIGQPGFLGGILLEGIRPGPEASLDFARQFAVARSTIRYITLSKTLEQKIMDLPVFRLPDRGILITISGPSSSIPRIADIPVTTETFSNIVEAVLERARSLLRGGVATDSVEIVHGRSSESYTTGKAGVANLLPSAGVEAEAGYRSTHQEHLVAGINSVKLSIGMAAKSVSPGTGALLVELDTSLSDDFRKQVFAELVARGAIIAMDVDTAVATGSEIDWGKYAGLVTTDMFQSVEEVADAIRRVGITVLEEVEDLITSTPRALALLELYSFSLLLKHFSSDIAVVAARNSAILVGERFYVLSPSLLKKRALEMAGVLRRGNDIPGPLNMVSQLEYLAPYLASLEVQSAEGRDDREKVVSVSLYVISSFPIVSMLEGHLGIGYFFDVFENPVVLGTDSPGKVEELVRSGTRVGVLVVVLPRGDGSKVTRFYLVSGGSVLGRLETRPKDSGGEESSLEVYPRPVPVRDIVESLREEGVKEVGILMVADKREYVLRKVAPLLARRLFVTDRDAGEVGRKVIRLLSVLSGRSEEDVVNLLAVVNIAAAEGNGRFTLDTVLWVAEMLGIRVGAEDIDSILLSPRIIVPERAGSRRFVVAAGHVVNSPLVVAKALVLRRRLSGDLSEIVQAA